MRGDLSELQANEGELAELQLLISRRRDLVTDRSRTITRLREALLALFPALERTLDLNNSSALTLVAHYQTPTALRRAGYKRVATYLKNRGIKGADTLAKKALAAAESQSAVLPAQDVASAIVAELAREALVLKQRIERVDEELKHRFFIRPEASILTSLAGMGPVLGAEFLVAAGDLSAFSSADQLAAYAGLGRPPTTPANGRATTTGCAAATRFSNGPSTSRRSPVCVLRLSPGPIMIAKGERARGTPRP